MAGQRSNFLVHWTGKDIHTDVNDLDDDKRREYVERLRGIVEKGLWMNMPAEGDDEFIFGHSRSVMYKSPITCFTEVRLSSASDHSKKYGLLGIAVERIFVLDRSGGPVHYVRNNAPEHLINNTSLILDFINSSNSEQAHNIYKAYSVNIAFFKPMSSSKTDDFYFIDEHEWRVVHTDKCEANGKIILSEKERPYAFIPLKASDVKIIIFPDDTTRTMAFNDKIIMKFFDKHTLSTLFMTLDECKSL